jgi:hypothetical protein
MLGRSRKHKPGAADEVLRNHTYPMSLLREQSPVTDEFGGREVLIVVGEDGRSVRAFDRVVNGRTLEFYQKVDAVEAMVLVDAETKTAWDFSGLATSGALAGTQLQQLQVYAGYWFDWKGFHPEGELFAAGQF